LAIPAFALNEAEAERIALRALEVATDVLLREGRLTCIDRAWVFRHFRPWLASRAPDSD
jgi:hypothetical protein